VKARFGLIVFLMKLRLSFYFGTIAAMLVVANHQPAQAQQDFSKVEIKVTKVSGHVYMLEGSGGNIGVSVGEDGIVIVDDEFAPLAPKIKAALKNITDKPLKFVLNTHFHGDHTGGNAEFSSEATIIAHENVRKRLKEGGAVLGGPVKPSPREALHHTDGDAVIYFQESNVLHMGDDFVTYGFPFVDVANGGSVSGMIAGLEKALGMVPQDVKIIPGHGAVSTPADVRKFIAMLKETRALVAAAVKEGKTADEMKSDHLLAKYDDLGKGFIKADKWIETLYSDVTQPVVEGAPAPK